MRKSVPFRSDAGLWLTMCVAALHLLVSSCNSDSRAAVAVTTASVSDAVKDPIASPAAVTAKSAPADAATILARKEVPILCYHQIRNYEASDSRTARAYIVPVGSPGTELEFAL